jgi:hypothetical protein
MKYDVIRTTNYWIVTDSSRPSVGDYVEYCGDVYRVKRHDGYCEIENSIGLVAAGTKTNQYKLIRKIILHKPINDNPPLHGVNIIPQIEEGDGENKNMVYKNTTHLSHTNLKKEFGPNYPQSVINNIELIKPLLNFKDEGDFYMLYVFKRKKDQLEGDRNNHQSVRTIKTYCIKSVEHLEKRYSEIIQLCEMFKARAYIHVQKQNHKDVSLEMMISLAERIKCGQSNQKYLFDSVVGQIKTNEKRWIVDIDTKDIDVVNSIKFAINKFCRPEGDKIEEVIPTKNGYHLITYKFDVMEFKKHFPEIEIQKKNPTLLYFPNSLN